MRRFLTLSLCSVILWVLVAQLNHAISAAQIYLSVGGLFVTYAALTQPFAVGFWVAIFAGLVLDANTPVAFGTHLILYATADVLIFRVRERVPRNDPVSRVAIAVVANLAVFIVFSLLELVRMPAHAAVWPRLLVDLLCSQVFLAVIAPWYFALQARALVLAGVERETIG